jgi:hypothetical protein
MNHRWKRWTDDEDAALRRLCRDGLDVGTIGLRLGRGRTSVYARICRLRLVTSFQRGRTAPCRKLNQIGNVAAPAARHYAPTTGLASEHGRSRGRATGQKRLSVWEFLTHCNTTSRGTRLVMPLPVQPAPTPTPWVDRSMPGDPTYSPRQFRASSPGPSAGPAI